MVGAYLRVLLDDSHRDARKRQHLGEGEGEAEAEAEAEAEGEVRLRLRRRLRLRLRVGVRDGSSQDGRERRPSLP